MTLAALLALFGRVVFSFVDPAITESSGLVDLGSIMVTTNDSGGDPLLFVVDPRTGRTVGRTTFADAVVDVEALAPAGVDEVWVGDIGDNDEQRDSVQVYRVPVAARDQRVAAPSYDLVYPDGPHDAESLVAGLDGRLYVITKGLLGGTAYVAPRHLDPDGPNRLRPVASVDLWVTDAAIFPDARHVLVRGYDSAAVLTFPAFRPVASFDLPHQRQGEGVSIGRSGRIRLSSEGVHSPVLQISLPDAVRAAVAGTPTESPNQSPNRSTSPSTGPSTSESPSASEAPRSGPGTSEESGKTLPKDWVVGVALVVVAATAVGVVLARRRIP